MAIMGSMYVAINVVCVIVVGRRLQPSSKHLVDPVDP